MARKEYKRLDLAIEIGESKDAGGRISVVVLERNPDGSMIPHPSAAPPKSIPQMVWQAWLASGVPDLRGWLDEAAVTFWATFTPTRPGFVRRVTVAVAEPHLAALDWETALRSELASPSRPPLPRNVIVSTFGPSTEVSIPVVRVVNGFSSATVRYLSSPLRMVEVREHVEPCVPEALRFALGHWADEPIAARAIRTQTVYAGELQKTLAREDWRVLDILHFSEYPRPASGDWLRGSPDEPGTRAWLQRLADTYLPRLIVLPFPDTPDRGPLRELAYEIASRGGPAVLVYKSSPADDGALYDSIIHDMPLDVAVARFTAPSPAVLVGGAGREDALRVSDIGAQLREIRQEALPGTLAIGQQRLEELGLDDLLLDKLAEFTNAWQYFNFDHEDGGLLPTTRALNEMRPSRTTRDYDRASSPKRGRPPERYLNASLWQQTLPAPPVRMSPTATLLRVGQPYLLGVQIGEPPVDVQNFFATPLDEKNFGWLPHDKGRWVQIGVAGVDFEVVGSTLKELWLPVNGPSKFVYFTVVPRTPRAARVRVILYYQNNVIQSLRLAALTLDPQEQESSTTLTALADALEIPFDQMRPASYATRLEYSLTSASARKLDERPARAVSIVANHSGGKNVITVNDGQAPTTVMLDDTIEDAITAVRDCLHRISRRGNASAEAGSQYGFDTPGNGGTQAELRDKFLLLAEEGWALFAGLFDDAKQRQALTDALEAEGQTIQVAHLWLERVIPWAALYDRKYDPRRTILPGTTTPVDHDVCFAAMPRADGSLPAVKCEADPNCILHAAQRAKRLQDTGHDVFADTVVCPLHFWGFKHRIELPPQDLLANDDTQGAKPTEIRECVRATKPNQFFMAYNPTMFYVQEHLIEMQGLAKWSGALSVRDPIVDALKNKNLDLIYFFCHAVGGPVENSKEKPYLDFSRRYDAQNNPLPTNPNEHITSADLAETGTWEHNPLVILNACHTLGFSPSAISPFVRRFMRERGAAGVLGTEIAVWEQLQREMAVLFLEQFLKGVPAGQALLHARRVFLGKNNPMGLIYTLYASAELKLAVDGKGNCA